ncbi:MAG TPA: HEAT repeat domain-containing protein [Planctomycetota bacterium]|nr:HEAT repeat domain-containing protein [Planctomycetota bacterium]
MLAATVLLLIAQTFTPDELAALDRALHAGNLTREDLAFDKAQTEGRGCLPKVREMLQRPLGIAPEMDRLAAQAHGPLALLAEGARLLEHEMGGAGGPEPAAPSTPEEAIQILERFAAAQPDVAPGAPRDALLAEMTWHMPSDAPKDGLHEAAAKLPLPAWPFGDPGDFRRWPLSAFPVEKPLVVDTPQGKIALGTPNDDTYEGDYAILVDPKGNDRYKGRFGAAAGTENRRVGLLVDLQGDDVYDCGSTDITLGAAVLGVAALLDLGQGDDRYAAGHVSLGAAIGGVALLYDDGGSDVYEGKTFTEGAAAFGVAVLFDDALQARPETTADEGTKEPPDFRLFDNDRVSAWADAQAFARPKGVAFCVNRRGNDIYEAGGVYLHAPLFSDRYQSFAQGFAIGSRDVDWAGGLAMLIDLEGNDRYLGDIYDQGVGYWYSAGLLWDGQGNDSYEMTQYGQGSGIHLAVGGLVDVEGNDTYVMHSGLGQGGSHDYAASILHDRGGNDRYMGATSCNGSALTNSVGLFIDRAGDDTYGARREGGLNTGRPARDFGSIGVMIDLGGKDDYLGPMEDGGVWRGTDMGVGADVDAPPSQGAAPAPPEPPPIAAKLPEGPLSQETFDKLWEIACRWEVGENRTIVPLARKRLIEFGPDVLPYLDARVETDQYGLELRAFVDVLRDLPSTEFLRRNATSESVRRRKVALYVIGELKARDLEDEVKNLLLDGELDRRAAAALAAIGSHAGDETLVTWLSGDGRHAAAAVAALLALEADVYPALRPLLGSADFAVRGRVVTGLAAHFGKYGDLVRADLALSDVRALRSVLDVLSRAEWSPSEADALALSRLVGHEDWGVRGDAARVIRAHPAPAAVDALEKRLAVETDPFVKAAAR